MARPAGAITVSRDAHVAFDDVYMAFEDREVLRGLTCEFPRGKISVILGGSGSGKTTVLRLIGGLIRPLRGSILVAGQDVTQLSDAELDTLRHKLGMMFQGGALLNSLTILDNLSFPLREHTSMRESEIADEVHRQLTAVGLSQIDDLLPGQLSGGMIKRAALARAIITKPEILLCDEPFSGLDPISVKRIEVLLRRINRTLQITMLVSSHHIPSTLRMADHLVLLRRQGAVSGTPVELQQSADPQVAAFFNEEINETIESPEDVGPERHVAQEW
jgi:phospholipid/cholesterol/gamma-HCH transport system ATP-binding protein